MIGYSTITSNAVDPGADVATSFADKQQAYTQRRWRMPLARLIGWVTNPIYNFFKSKLQRSVQHAARYFVQCPTSYHHTKVTVLCMLHIPTLHPPVKLSIGISDMIVLSPRACLLLQRTGTCGDIGGT